MASLLLSLAVFAALPVSAASLFSTTGSMNTGRKEHATVLLADGKVLVVGGSYFGNSLATAEVYNPVTHAWSATGSLGMARFQHTATRLADGKVLVVGGYGDIGSPTSSELYDPATGTWSATTGSLSVAHGAHTATLLANGKVLVTGGNNPTSEIYDPATGTWSTPPGAPSTGRTLHTATLLPNGKVLVAGGWSGSTSLASAELFDPATGTWSATGSLGLAQHTHAATLLANGKVLVSGASSELYDPTAGTWSATTGALGTPRFAHTSTLLPSGKVLVAAGRSSANLGSLDSGELYDPVTGVWSATTGLLKTVRSGHTATLLATGRVLIAAGDSTAAHDKAELFDEEAIAFSPASAPGGVRYSATGTLLPSGKVLVAGGSDGNAAVATAQLYDPVTGAWSATGSLVTARESHTAALLPNGKVLVAGGYDGGSPFATAELYDPVTGTWGVTGSLVTARSFHTMTLLANGKVLVAGGYNGGTLASAELYDPATGTWSTTDSLTSGVWRHAATLLANGKVLVTGGYGTSDFMTSSELFDPATGTWSATGSLSQKRSGHTATLLTDGKVLVAGGYIGLYLASSELYDPATGVWSATTGPLPGTRAFHSATLLPNGKVLAATGSDAGAVLFDPATGTWSNTGDLTAHRSGHTATLLANGKVLMAAGDPGGTAELYDSAVGAWAATGSLAVGRLSHTATLLRNGKVLVAGGYDGISHASAELYDPATGEWNTAASLASARNGHTATLLFDGKVLVVGGHNDSSYLATAELYDPVTGIWSATGSLAEARYHHSATLLPDGKVLVAGGDNFSALVGVELYDPATGIWSATDELAVTRRGHTATLLPNGKVLVVGGWYGSAHSSATLYDLATGTWSATGSLAVARYEHTATLLPNGKVLIAGGNGTSGYLTSAELYDPATGTWSATGSLAVAQSNPTATLTPNGEVLVVGGFNGSSSLTNVELYDPATGVWTSTDHLAIGRSANTATLLPNGKVLIAGGYDGMVASGFPSAELYDIGLGFVPASQPVISTVSLTATEALVLTGSNLTGLSSASGGNGNQDSPSNTPVVQVRRLDNQQTTFLRSDPSTNTSATSFTSVSMSGLPYGHYTVTAFTNGIPSAAVIFGFLPPVEMQVTGNSQSIANGDIYPSPSDDTDFGNVALVNDTLTRSFTLTNAGLAPLSITGITLSGATAADFAITTQAASSVVAAGSTTVSITFDPRASGLRTALVSIFSNDLNDNPYTFAISGVGALAAKRPQTISFNAPATVYMAQSPVAHGIKASSGLPVIIEVLSGPAGVEVDDLILLSPGTVKLELTQPGDALYAAAPTVRKTIVVKANPTTLTLINLAQVYNGSPRPISTLGGSSPVISYKIGTAAFGPTAPTNAGSYPVSVTDGAVTKTGTLVIAKAVLDVTPDDKRKFAGRANPALTAVITGYQGSDTPAVVTTAPVLSTTATLTSARGLYPITAKSGAALNYSFNYRQGTLAVESFVGGYEALLVDGGDLAVGKLNITVTGAASFTGKLYVSPEAAPLPLTGTLASNPSTGQASSTVLNIASDGTPYVTSFTMPLSDAEPMTASVVRDNTAFGTAADGRKLGTAAVLYAGAHTAVFEPATPAGISVPPGAGWATAKIDSKGVLTLTGKLGDSIAFTSALSPDTASNPGYRLFAQPYLAKRTGSYLGGKFSLAAHPSLANRRHLEAAALTWSKLGLPADATYRAGFGPVSTVLMIDPWLAPKTTAPTVSLAQRLGLPGTAFNVSHSATGSASNADLPTQLNLSATNVVSVLLPLANLTKWKTLTFVPTTGTFTGSFELTDAIKRTVTFSGVLRQPTTALDNLIGDGHYLLPPLVGTEKTTGEVIFTRP